MGRRIPLSAIQDDEDDDSPAQSGGAEHGQPGDRDPVRPPDAEPWPALPVGALRGLAGDIVQAIDPFTEADPVAVLLHILTAFGNVIGDGAHCRVERTRHPFRLFTALVGDTAKARKGLSSSTPSYLFSVVDPQWAAQRVTSGLSSGEGLINAVRDARVEREPVRGRGGRVEDYQEVTVDHGVEDKRLLIVEQEFAGALKAMSREGNILSVTIRQAWDSGDLRPLTKNNPIRATGGHISIIAHITREELLRHLNETEQANGFANRFLWALVRRSKLLPEGSGVPDEILAPFLPSLTRAVFFARRVGEMARDRYARALWRAEYPRLSAAKPGLLGAVVARAEAQTLRLSGLYALLDRSPVIGRPHLAAALALWRYMDASAHLIFGSRLGNSIADRIVLALRPRGRLSETEIRDLFARNVRAAEIDAALDLIRRLGLGRSTSEATGGRPRTVWTLTA